MSDEPARPVVGTFLFSRFEERWDNWEASPTRDEAIDYGINVMEWDGVEDGEIFYTGKIATFTPDELAAEADINADRTIFGIELSILEVAGDPGDGGPPLPTTAEQRADLDTRLRDAVKAWLVDHAITPGCYRIVDIERHAYQQCELY